MKKRVPIGNSATVFPHFDIITNFLSLDWPIKLCGTLGVPMLPISYKGHAHMLNSVYTLHIHFHHRSPQHYAPIPFFSRQSNLPEPKTNQRILDETFII